MQRGSAEPGALTMNSVAPGKVRPYSIRGMKLPIAHLCLSAALLLLLGDRAPAAGDDASPWDGDARSAARLVASADTIGPALRAGIEIRLSPGWHTYWRYPGDAGVPPQFDFAGSSNLKNVEVLWPAPHRLPEAGLTAIGYERDVILPLRVLPQDRSRPVILRLKLNYAICEKLCVPAEAKVGLSLAGGNAAQEAALAAAEARVPRKLALGQGPALSVRAVRQEQGPERPRLVIDLAAGSRAVDLFAEGPTPDWSLPLPVPVDGAPPGSQRFVMDLDGAPPGEGYDGALITLTAVAGADAIEVPVRLQ
jgi:DsbC/DsbD-like thiol-disulfide interchange protein